MISLAASYPLWNALSFISANFFGTLPRSDSRSSSLDRGKPYTAATAPIRTEFVAMAPPTSIANPVASMATTLPLILLMASMTWSTGG